MNVSADPAIYKEAVVYETAQTPHRVLAVEHRAFEPLEQPDETYPTIFVDVDKTFQTIEGFGGAFTDASADNFAKLSPEAQESFLKACFDPTEGSGYTILRCSWRRALASCRPTPGRTGSGGACLGKPYFTKEDDDSDRDNRSTAGCSEPGAVAVDAFYHLEPHPAVYSPAMRGGSPMVAGLGLRRRDVCDYRWWACVGRSAESRSHGRTGQGRRR